ncbi:MAG: patatin [Pseudonocardiales bacterium]|nr:MAG: patatin [Pseudonocardiales bacterium]
MTPARPAPRRAIVLGGGGVLGFAWILGALSALEAVAGFDVRDVDIAVGTSAGSVAAGLLGCGVPLDAICRHHQGMPAPADPPIAYDYAGATGGALPPRPGLWPGSPRLLLGGLRHPLRLSPIVTLAGLLPTGRGTLAPVHDLMAGVASEAGFAERWPARPRPWVVAADYHVGRRIVFGRDNFASRAAIRSADGVHQRSAADVVTVPRIIRRASLADAVTASCSIPAWYPPTVIDGVPYIDGGTLSNASVDVLQGTGVGEVYVLAPMASVETDRARTPIGRVERLVRRAITRGILADVAALRATGMRVYLVTPEPADLAVIGLNLMNPARRTEVFETAQGTAAGQLARQLSSSAGRAAARVAGDLPGQTPA